jgi:hypothetical protein
LPGSTTEVIKILNRIIWHPTEIRTGYIPHTGQRREHLQQMKRKENEYDKETDEEDKREKRNKEMKTVKR